MVQEWTLQESGHDHAELWVWALSQALGLGDTLNKRRIKWKDPVGTI